MRENCTSSLGGGRRLARERASSDPTGASLAEGPNGSLARGLKERSTRLPRNGGSASVGRRPIWDETVVGAVGDETPVKARWLMPLSSYPICRTAVYVTRSYGGVGGGSREVFPYPEWALTSPSEDV